VQIEQEAALAARRILVAADDLVAVVDADRADLPRRRAIQVTGSGIGWNIPCSSRNAGAIAPLLLPTAVRAVSSAAGTAGAGADTTAAQRREGAQVGGVYRGRHGYRTLPEHRDRLS
jgi:hypothetical protein